MQIEKSGKRWGLWFSNHYYLSRFRRDRLGPRTWYAVGSPTRAGALTGGMKGIEAWLPGTDDRAPLKEELQNYPLKARLDQRSLNESGVAAISALMYFKTQNNQD